MLPIVLLDSLLVIICKLARAEALVGPVRLPLALIGKLGKIGNCLLLERLAVHGVDEIAVDLREHVIDVLLPLRDDVNDVELDKHEHGKRY
mmetsp:Transcript_5869/g.7953  ORF Transcript_5869/g.7953 Transcript_5869/m.7953 type:complete len:91 (-) Transcript_5869:121-393(-)